MSKAFMNGNIAMAEAAVRAGCRFFAGYPITPQNEVPEYMSVRQEEVGGVFIQAESELTAINMVEAGAALGVRSMTSTSGPGLALMAETLGHICLNLPAVIVDVVRGGPGGGNVFASQQDYFTAVKAPCPGGIRCFVMAPEGGQEVTDMVYEAFDIADKYLKPVIILSDSMVGNVYENIELPPFRELKDLPDKSSWSLAKRGSDGKPRGYTSAQNSVALQEAMNIHCAETYEIWKKDEQRWEEFMLEDAQYVIAAYGSVARVCKSVILELRKEGIKIGLLRPKTLFPFPNKGFDALDYTKVRKVFDVELSNPPQFGEDVLAALKGRCEMTSIIRTGGVVMGPDEILSRIKNAL